MNSFSIAYAITNKTRQRYARFVSRRSSRDVFVRAFVTLNVRHGCPFVRDDDNNLGRDFANAIPCKNTRFQFHPVIGAARKKYAAHCRSRPGPGATRRFAFPVRGISFRVLGSFPKQTETELLNGHRIATATPSHRKRERNANSTGTNKPCASFIPVLLAASRSGPFDRFYIMNDLVCI